ncbi:hypothetical protein T4D_1399, partial [Trichinella pseudospiralis]
MEKDSSEWQARGRLIADSVSPEEGAANIIQTTTQLDDKKYQRSKRRVRTLYFSPSIRAWVKVGSATSCWVDPYAKTKFNDQAGQLVERLSLPADCRGTWRRCIFKSALSNIIGTPYLLERPIGRGMHVPADSHSFPALKGGYDYLLRVDLLPVTGDQHGVLYACALQWINRARCLEDVFTVPAT